MRTILILIAGTFAFAVASTRITSYYELEKWQVSVALLLIAVVLLVLNSWLIRYFVKKRTPELWSPELVGLTGELGIVPKWVALIGLTSYAAMIAAVGPWLIALIR